MYFMHLQIIWAILSRLRSKIDWIDEATVFIFILFIFYIYQRLSFCIECAHITKFLGNK